MSLAGLEPARPFNRALGPQPSVSTNFTTATNNSLKNGRRNRTRTCDPLLPKQMRYQTALHAVLCMNTLGCAYIKHGRSDRTRTGIPLRASGPKPGASTNFATDPCCLMVGDAGFEPATPCTPCKCATRLRQSPKKRSFNC